MKISMDRKYETRCGQKVRLLYTNGGGSYPVAAIIGKDASLKAYTSKGRYSERGMCDFDLIKRNPMWDDFKMDDPVMVKYEDEVIWRHRYFAGISKDGKPTTWLGSATSWSVENGATTVWDECRRPTKEELEE